MADTSRSMYSDEDMLKLIAVMKTKAKAVPTTPKPRRGAGMFTGAMPSGSGFKPGYTIVGSTPTKKKKRGLNKTKGGQPIIYLIDADTHAYRAAAAADGRFYECEDRERFKYKKDADAHCKQHGLKYPPALAFEPEPVANALKLLRDSLEEFDGRTCEYFVTGKTNFRYKITPDYKGNRKGGRVPQHLGVCKEALMDRGAVLDENLEADDLVIIRAKQLERAGIPWVIVGCDKDLKQIPGSFYDPFANKREVVTLPVARENLWRQIATGDSTDNIKSPKGIGLYKSKAKQESGESDNNYTARIMMWIKQVASLVFLRRAPEEEYQLPSKSGKLDRSTRVDDDVYSTIRLNATF